MCGAYVCFIFKFSFKLTNWNLCCFLACKHLQVIFINFIWDAQITATPNWYNVSAGEYDNCRVVVSAQCRDTMNIFVKLQTKILDWQKYFKCNKAQSCISRANKKCWIFALILSFSLNPRSAFTIMNILELLINSTHHLLNELAISNIRKSSEVSQLFWKELCWMKCSWHSRNNHLS